MLDLTRSEHVFNAVAFNLYQEFYETTVTLIGAGAVGSAVAMNLAKLGVERVMLIDPDIVEEHNVGNQLMYGIHDIGKPKVEALSLSLNCLTGCDFSPYKMRLGVQEKILSTARHKTNILIMAVDSMASRMEIFQKECGPTCSVQYLMDGRMGKSSWQTHTWNLVNTAFTGHYENDTLVINAFETEWYPDSDVPDETVGGCSITPSILPTALTVASSMAWSFIKVANNLVKQDINPKVSRYMGDCVKGSTNPWSTHVAGEAWGLTGTVKK